MEFLWIFIAFISVYIEVECEKIRCRCNLKKCDPKSKICMSENGGGCFSDFPKDAHGCLSFLNREQLEQCDEAPGANASRNSFLFCCKTDRCNFVFSPTYLRTLGTLVNLTGNDNLLKSVYEDGSSPYHGYNTNEVWFKAATIAVPICGAMILLMLIGLAFKILRADHVTVTKYCSGDSSSNSNANSHIVSFKGNELNPKDAAKKVPLLYETRQNEVRNCEDFRSFTATRIHYGQNVNVLKDAAEQANPKRAEKNLEYAKINMERPRLMVEAVTVEPATSTSSTSADPSSSLETNNNNNSISVDETSNSTLDVRVVEVSEKCHLPSLSLNLEKNDCLNSCNIYNSPTTADRLSADVSNALDKLYDKYLL